MQNKDDLRTVETKMRSWLHSWRGARHRGVSGQQAAPGPQMAGHRKILSTVTDDFHRVCWRILLLFNVGDHDVRRRS